MNANQSRSLEDPPQVFVLKPTPSSMQVHSHMLVECRSMCVPKG